MFRNTKVCFRAATAVIGVLSIATLVNGQTAIQPPCVNGPLTGAIFTTDANGNLVNGNVYDDCCDVYLNGGPPTNAPCTSAGLPNGEYYFQVTDPSGAVLLSTDPIEQRRVRVEGGVIVQYFGTSGTCEHTVGLGKCHQSIANNISIQLMPFSPTPNPGGVYKAWMTRVEDYDLSDPLSNFGFRESCCKTDNFKCAGPPGTGACCLSCPPPFQNTYLGTCIPLTETECLALGGEYQGDGSECDGPTCGSCPENCLIECPPDVTVACGGSIDPSDTGTGVCLLLGCELSYEDESLGCPAVITRTWKCTNPATGLFVSCDQTITTEGASICARKFYDANMNGNWDVDEVAIENWPIIVTNGEDPIVGYTDANGIVCFEGLCPTGNYTIYEVLPPNWKATTPSSVDFEPLGCEQSVDFGNICLNGPNNGKTIGYWSNNNGKAVLQANDPQWRYLLNSLNLRRADGTFYTVSTSASFTTAYSNFRTWLLNANATNMAYMLSAQLAATTLNNAYKGLSDDAVLVVPGGMKSGSICIVPFLSVKQKILCGAALLTVTAVPGSNACGCTANDATVTVGAVRAKAICLLGSYGLTTTSSTARKYEEAVKNLLDIINNNGNNGSPCGPPSGGLYLQSGPCPF